ncbi:hypothetical protein BU14_3083s0001, partial [Porphyra umbilicalis]
MADEGGDLPDVSLLFVTLAGFGVTIFERTLDAAPYARVMILTPLVVAFYATCAGGAVALLVLMLTGRVANSGEQYAGLFSLVSAAAWPAATHLTRTLRTWGDDELHRASGVGKATWAALAETATVAAAAAAAAATAPTAAAPPAGGVRHGDSVGGDGYPPPDAHLSAACALMAEQSEWAAPAAASAVPFGLTPAGSGGGAKPVGDAGGEAAPPRPGARRPWHDRLTATVGGGTSPLRLVRRWWAADVRRSAASLSDRPWAATASVYGRLAAEAAFSAAAAPPLAALEALHAAARWRVRRAFAAVTPAGARGHPSGAAGLPRCAAFCDVLGGEDPRERVGPEYWPLVSA